MIRSGFRLLRRSMDHGGLTAMVLGSQGTGKTTFLLSKIVWPLIDSKEIMFWRGTEFCQWCYIPPEKVNILLSPFYDYVWIDRERGRRIKPSELGLAVHTCYEPEDYYVKAKRGRLNVVYMTDEEWMEFSKYLNMRPDINWISLFVDEVQRYFPEYSTGKHWRYIYQYSNLIADFRKNFINFYCACQSHKDVDSKIRSKMMFNVYLQGYVPPRESRVSPVLLRKLNLGQAIIEEMTGKREFRVTEFEKLTKHFDLLVKIAPVLGLEATVKDEKD
ncbi:MAG: hypothetical protein J7K49_04940 [Thaumarchaeota archaeon]|nr:hypothetical protein [Nitrososphaerota archaeon]